MSHAGITRKAPTATYVEILFLNLTAQCFSAPSTHIYGEGVADNRGRSTPHFRKWDEAHLLELVKTAEVSFLRYKRTLSFILKLSLTKNNKTCPFHTPIFVGVVRVTVEN